jgi:hypothetical protein
VTDRVGQKTDIGKYRELPIFTVATIDFQFARYRGSTGYLLSALCLKNVGTETHISVEDPMDVPPTLPYDELFKVPEA